MIEKNLAEYIGYEKKAAERNHNYKWTMYLRSKDIGSNYISGPLEHLELREFMLSQDEVQKYPWLVALFTEKNLSAFVKARQQQGLETSYIDYMGPGNWTIFDEEIPDRIFAVSLADANENKASDNFRARTTTIHSNIYDVRKTVALLRKNNFISANITTETAKGPFWRFYEGNLINEFPLEMVWENYFFMLRTAYSMSDADGSVLLIQIPNINTRNKEKLTDGIIDKRLLDYLNSSHVPAFICGDMLICIKSHASPKVLKRTPFNFIHY